MPFSIRPYRRFPVECSNTRLTGLRRMLSLAANWQLLFAPDMHHYELGASKDDCRKYFPRCIGNCQADFERHHISSWRDLSNSDYQWLRNCC
jgi:hypothetical protein